MARTARERRRRTPWLASNPMEQLLAPDGNDLRPAARYLASHVAHIFERNEYDLSRGKVHVLGKLWHMEMGRNLSYTRWREEGSPDEFRPVMSLSVQDRLIHGVAADVLRPVVEAQLLDNVVSYRDGEHFGVEGALKRISGWVKAGFTRFLRMDVGDYDATVNHQILKDRVTDLIKPRLDRESVADLMKVLDAYLVQSAEILKPKKPGCGLVSGSPLIPYLTNFYLTPLDKVIAAAGFDFIRYGDDVLIALDGRAPDKLLAEVKRVLAEQEQEVHEDKTRTCRIFSAEQLGLNRGPYALQDICKALPPHGEHLEFLGYAFIGEQAVIRPETIYKIKNRIWEIGFMDLKWNHEPDDRRMTELKKIVRRLNHRLGYEDVRKSAAPEVPRFQFIRRGWAQLIERTHGSLALDQCRGLDSYMRTILARWCQLNPQPEENRRKLNQLLHENQLKSFVEVFNRQHSSPRAVSSNADTDDIDT